MSGWLLLLMGMGLLAAAWTILWITSPRVPAEASENAGDPYAAEIARFRQQVHDWDRRA